jgi:hypothetical protein
MNFRPIILSSLALLYLFAISVQNNPKSFPIKMGRFPYTEAIEWNDKGILLFARNPQNKTETMVTFVNEKHDNVFTESLNHQAEKFYILQDAKAKFLYFFENFEQKNGNVMYHQLNSTGDIKPQKLAFSQMMKNLGNYPVEKLKMRDVIVCSKGVVLLYECEKEKDILTEIAFFITDNNCSSYAAILGTRVKKTKFENEAYAYHYSGNTEKHVTFCRNSQDNKRKGFETISYTYNGKVVASQHLDIDKNFMLHQQTYIGQTGAYSMNKSLKDIKGQVFYYNDEPYIIGYETVNGKVQLSSYAKNDKGIFELRSAHNFGPKLEGTVQLGVEETTKGFLLRMGSNKMDICALMEEGRFETNTCPYVVGLIENPFIAYMSVKTTPDRWYLGYSKSPENVFSFSKKQLNTKQDITFDAL